MHNSLGRWIRSQFSWSGLEAAARLSAGHPPAKMYVSGNLDLRRVQSLRALPGQLTAQRLDISDCRNLRTLPDRLTCSELIAQRTELEHLPEHARISRRVDLADCRRLHLIPPLTLDDLNLTGCVALQRLPEGLRVRRLNVSRCTALTALPPSVAKSVEVLNVSGCVELSALPETFAQLQTLEVSDCRRLETLSEGILLRRRIDVAGSGLRALPWSLRSVRIHWRGVPVSDRIAFDPESITAEEILAERNLQLRSVLLERIGLSRFVEQSLADVLDEDFDVGGPRRLLRVAMKDGDDLVCVQVQCPSTGQRYLLRVPPTIRTCREGVAWTAGILPEHYHPIRET